MSACGQAALSSCGPPRTDAWLCPVPVPVVRTVILRLSSQGRGSICRAGRVPGATHFRSPAAGTAFHEARRREKSMALGALGDINGGLFSASAGLRAPHPEAKIAPGNAPGGHLTPPWKTSHPFPATVLSRLRIDGHEPRRALPFVDRRRTRRADRGGGRESPGVRSRQRTGLFRAPGPRGIEGRAGGSRRNAVEHRGPYGSPGDVPAGPA